MKHIPNFPEMSLLPGRLFGIHYFSALNPQCHREEESVVLRHYRLTINLSVRGFSGFWINRNNVLPLGVTGMCDVARATLCHELSGVRYSPEHEQEC